MRAESADFEVILGNSNKRFSGVTSTMLQVLLHQQHLIAIRVLGSHHLSEDFRAISFLQLARIAGKPLANNRPRIFHARRNDEMIQALLLKHLFRCKLKIVFTSTAQRKKTWITRWLMSKMDALLSTCQAAANYMTYPPDSIIPHGINTDVYKPNQSEPTLSLDRKLKLIGIFGRVRSQKGVDLLVAAAISVLPNHREWGLIIVGEVTPEHSVFKNILSEKLSRAGLAERVSFTGKVSFEQLPKYFAKIDIAVALSRNEGFGLTVLEAMSSAKPVVVTKAGAWPDIIEHAIDGFLIDVDDQEALETHLLSLIHSETLRVKMGEAARAKVLEFYTVQREAERLVGFYRKIQNSGISAN